MSQQAAIGLMYNKVMQGMTLGYHWTSRYLINTGVCLPSFIKKVGSEWVGCCAQNSHTKHAQVKAGLSPNINNGL